MRRWVMATCPCRRSVYESSLGTAGDHRARTSADFASHRRSAVKSRRGGLGVGVFGDRHGIWTGGVDLVRRGDDAVDTGLGRAEHETGVIAVGVEALHPDFLARSLDH